jgi:predicted house-cleaning noncanonical NTP pyrophosphatase (MazG superfamily)
MDNNYTTAEYLKETTEKIQEEIKRTVTDDIISEFQDYVLVDHGSQG